MSEIADTFERVALVGVEQCKQFLQAFDGEMLPLFRVKLSNGLVIVVGIDDEASDKEWLKRGKYDDAYPRNHESQSRPR